MARLDDPQLQFDLLTAMGRHGKIEQAAQEIGLSRRSISAYLKTHPDLREAVDVARRRSAVLAHHVPAMTARGDVGPRPAGVDHFSEAECDWFIAQLKSHVEDPNSRGCAKAIDVLAQLHFARELLAIRAEAKRAEADATAGDQRPAVIRVPAVPQRAHHGVIDAEVLDDRSDGPRG